MRKFVSCGLLFLMLFMISCTSILYLKAQNVGGIEWTKYPGNPLTSLGQDTVADPWVIFDGSIYKIWFRKWDAEGIGIYYSTSSDGITWTTPVRTDLEPGASGSWDESIQLPCVIYDGELYRMWYMGQGVRDGPHRVGLATSSDGITWTKYENNPVLTPSSSGWDGRAVGPGPVIKQGDTYLMWYTGGYYPWQIGLATSADGKTWQKHANNPVLKPGPPDSWDSTEVYFASVVRVGNEYRMWYMGM